MNWTIACPVWGDWYVKQYLTRTLPYHKRMGLKGKYIVHTNQRAALEPHLDGLGCEVEFRTLPADPSNYMTYAQCHNEVFRESQACMFLAADIALSEGSFEVVRAAVEDLDTKLVMMNVMRTVSETGDEPPYDPRGMNEWAIRHIHYPMKTCTWGRQPPSMKPVVIFFEDGENFWMRGFHIHPIAAVRDDRYFDLTGTVDGTLVTSYLPTECWVVQKQEIAGVDFTHESKLQGDVGWNMSDAMSVANIMRDGAKSIHRHFFCHKIAIRGEPTKKYDAVAREIYCRL